MSLDKDDLSRHLSAQFNSDLVALVEEVREMGQLVHRQLADALRALERGDADLAGRVIARDPEVNRLELRLDEECRDVLVRRQPAAGDLRVVFAIIKGVIDLERMGDLAKRVAKAAQECSGPPQARFGAPIAELGAAVLALSEKALGAFTEFDGVTAALVKNDDRAIDARVRSMTFELESFIREHPDATGGALQLIWAARALERFGDHAKNIADYVFYAVHGKEVRHMSDVERAQWVPQG
jgi:phosphate transport system protein